MPRWTDAFKSFRQAMLNVSTVMNKITTNELLDEDGHAYLNLGRSRNVVTGIELFEHSFFGLLITQVFVFGLGQ